MSAPKYCPDPDLCEYSDCPTAFCDRISHPPMATTLQHCESCGDHLDNGHGQTLGDLWVCDVCYRSKTEQGKQVLPAQTIIRLGSSAIVFHQRANDWHAQIEGEPDFCGCGRGPCEAVGSLVRSWPERFAVLPYDYSQGGQGA